MCHKKKVSTLMLGLMLCIPFLSHAESSPASPEAIQATLAEIGQINGQALACKYSAVSNRAKQLVITQISKTREHGEVFESATQNAFLGMANETSCPPQAGLTLKLEKAARTLGAPLSQILDAQNNPPDETTPLNPRYLLQADNGRAIMDGDFPKQFQLISFGYTYCPDICPTTLVEMAEVLKQLGDKAEQIQPIFISVDPERDTLAVLRTYTRFFHPRILGATGSPALINHAAQNFKVRYEKVASSDASNPHYAVDHTAGMYLLAPGGNFVARFPYGTPVDTLKQRLDEEITTYQNSRAQENKAQ